MLQLSFLIPALNEASKIGDCIRSIKSYVPMELAYEIVVGDHGSADNTASIAESLGARVVHYHRSTIAEFRNYLIDQSSGAIIVFVDADVCITPQWGSAISDVIDSIASNPDQLTGSRCTPPPSSNFVIRNWFAKMPLDGHDYLGTGHMIFSRNVIQRIGKFDPTLRTGEDYEYCKRATAAGLSIRINPALTVFHHDYPRTVAGFIKREKWHGSGDAQSLHHVLSSKVALAALAFLAFHGALLIGLFFYWPLAVVAAVFIVMLVTTMSFLKFSALSWRARLANIILAYCYLTGRSLSLLPI